MFFSSKSELKKHQAKVYKSVAIGAVLIAVLYYSLDYLLPKFCAGSKDALGNIIFTLRWSVLPLSVIIINLFTVSIGRMTSMAIDPQAGKEDKTLKIHISTLRNSFEQFTLFLVSMLAMSTYANCASLRIIAILTIIFTIGRILFWIGYQKNPECRAGGFLMSLVYLPVFICTFMKLLKFYIF